MTPVDPVTYDRVWAVLARARALGRDPVEQLNHHGLLLTPAQEKRIRLEAMSYIWEQMGQWSPAAFLRRKIRNLNVATVQDLYTCIHEWIQEQINSVREEK